MCAAAVVLLKKLNKDSRGVVSLAVVASVSRVWRVCSLFLTSWSFRAVNKSTVIPRPFSYGMLNAERTVAYKHNAICEFGWEVQEQIGTFKMAKAGKRRGHIRGVASPRWCSPHNVDFIQGDTLVRFSVVQKDASNWTCHVRHAARSNQQCDRCKGSHRDSNGRCSQSIGVRTHCTSANVLYDFNTGRPAFTIVRISVSFGRKKRFGHATVAVSKYPGYTDGGDPS